MDDNKSTNQAVIRTLNISSRAASQLKTIINGQAEAGKTLRVFTEGCQCSGLQYGFAFDDKRPDDLELESEGIRFLLDPKSAGSLEGATIDYSEAGEFTVANIPGKHDCGC